jgi:glycerol-3-phosphate dehydrogenase (NAD(P)+)
MGAPVAQERVSISVVGAGSWGTALASHLARSGHSVRLWGRDPVHMEALAAAHRNDRYLPGIQLPSQLRYSADLDAATAPSDAILIATPSYAFHEFITRLTPRFHAGAALMWACKGLEQGSGKMLHEIAQEALGRDVALAIVSGPTFAKEVGEGLPAAVSVASPQLEFAAKAAGWMHGENVRAYSTDDLIGVELGGALKNALAIAAGIADGLGFGANSRAALITRGLAEIIRLGVSLGGKRETFMGLAGLGDLVLTCTDDLSRNRRMGLALAQGYSVKQALDQIGQAVEGVNTAREALRLARRQGVEMPIVEQVHAVIYAGKSPTDAVRDLLRRDPKRE